MDSLITTTRNRQRSQRSRLCVALPGFLTSGASLNMLLDIVFYQRPPPRDCDTFLRSFNGNVACHVAAMLFSKDVRAKTVRCWMTKSNSKARRFSSVRDLPWAAAQVWSGLWSVNRTKRRPQSCSWKYWLAQTMARISKRNGEKCFSSSCSRRNVCTMTENSPWVSPRPPLKFWALVEASTVRAYWLSGLEKARTSRLKNSL